MAGLYVHIPFCQSRCFYCGFYSTTQNHLQQRYIDTVCHELALSASHPEISSPFNTVYIGGGTPSQLSPSLLRQLFQAIRTFACPPSPSPGPQTPASVEVTLEVNPDDVTPEFAELVKSLPVNRISMGVQTFSDERLRFLRRRHNSRQAAEAVAMLREAGVRNLSIDLMYGFPGETLDQWLSDVSSALSLGVEHISAYALMYEEGTPLYRLLERGAVKETDEELSRQMFYTLKDRLEAAGYEHYEISNFARPNHRSLHNSSYWNFTPYLGLGAAAHSFSGQRRWWNVAHLIKYIETVESAHCLADLKQECETITPSIHYDEVVMLRLRTRDGICLDSQLTPEERAYCMQAARRFLDDGLLECDGHHLRLSRNGLFVSNMVMSGLMKG